MQLKRIKIFGFKSFADEVEFDFSPGITAIVGPNGCGKSNVLDAFNWVLGEQSAGRLRGGQMQDMIFHGSRTRKPIGVAQVELTLDNSKDILPIDYDQVTVSRKLYRSGESEYMINKVPCRLKDIKELFMDTGIGRRAYSVMEQSNISYILESSPHERRSLIEEAAGIRKYKEKKLEAERRLERIRTDLNEVKNIMGEVQKNIRRLKLQTKRAQLYKELRKELKQLEMSKLCQEYNVISEQLSGRLEKTQVIQAEVAKFSIDKEKLDNKVLELENQRMNIDDRLLGENRSVYQLESRMAIVKERIDNFEDSKKRLLEENDRLSKNLKYNTALLERLNSELKELEKNTAKGKEVKDKYMELDAKIAALVKEQENVQKSLEEFSNNRKKLEEQIFDLRNNEIKLKNQLDLSDSKAKELQDKKTSIESRLSGLNKEIDERNNNVKKKEKELSDASENIKNLNSLLLESNKKIEVLLKNKESLQKDYHSTKSLFDAGKQYLPQYTSLEELSHKKIKGIKGQLSVLLESHLSEAESQEISSILGEKMFWVVSDNHASATKAIEFLKEQNLPPLTFILLDKIKSQSVSIDIPEKVPEEMKKVLSYFLAGVKIEPGFVIKADCLISGGGETPPRVKKIIGLESEIEKIEEKLNKTGHQEKEFKTKRQDLQKELNDIINNRNSMQNDISSSKAQLGQLKGNLEYLNNELKSIANLISGIKPKTALEEDINKNLIKQEELNTELKNIFESIKKGSQQNFTLTEDIAKNSARRSALKEIIDREKENIVSTKRQITQATEDSSRIKKLLGDLELRLENITGQNKSDVKEIEEIKKEKDQQNRQIGEIEDDKGKLVKELKELKKQQKELGDKLDNMKNSVGEQRQTEERLKERINSITVRLKENFGTSIEEAMKDYLKEEIDEELLSEKRQKLEKIGDVNLEAPKEYDREYQRFEFIKKHVDDLEEADQDLKNIIRRINKQTKDRFFEIYTSINENFKSIFTKLFEGGKAEMKLSDPDNILESGIEIFAQPEGKNVSSIIQLSGGESALTAIALMFAIYQVKPTPFCILDEVDSPLDDANLHRFLRMLRDYINTTQFIIVTHNKQTMEMSDTFYGITMEEFGVSKTISVKLRDTKEQAS